MRPLALVNGMLLGTLGAIFIGLAVVVFIFLLLAAENPVLREELPILALNTAVFGLLAGIAALAFLGQLKMTAWRWYAEAALGTGLFGLGWYYLV